VADGPGGLVLTMTQYGTLEELKQSVDPPVTDSIDDEYLDRILTVASRSIDAECDRIFYQVGTTLVPAVIPFVPDNATALVVPSGVLTVTLIEVDTDDDNTFSTAWAAGDWRLEPITSELDPNAPPYTVIMARNSKYFPTDGRLIRVTGTFGWATTPESIQAATMMLATRLWKRRGSPLGIAGFGDMGPVYVRNTDPDIARLVAPFKRWSVG